MPEASKSKTKIPIFLRLNFTIFYMNLQDCSANSNCARKLDLDVGNELHFESFLYSMESAENELAVKL